ncbi:peptidase M50B-like protein [Georgenia soli]|uniref:Peptidase M50B-like protein n=1 Tax=Georgenia soli TaxID=638953 RepID=A0A2A9EPB4_9MICO|nr:M50 family metallopeptidase [Georgenia soli]PFG40080.1 peptidase M50B-like protein [Georgenia soli]
MGETLDDVGPWLAEAWSRLRPGPVPAEDAAVLAVVVAAVVAAVAVPLLWRHLRVVVTVVHELGHGLVGVLCGRRFTGFVLRGDMSGHAVTVGPARGAGRVLSTWAGYPAPAVVGALLVRAAGTGWAPTVLGVGALVLLVSLVRVRSWYTALVMVALTAATAALWWWVGGALQAAVLLGVGLFLLVGAWRHLGALLGSRSPGSDAAVLAGLTRVPRWCWVLSFAVVLGLASWFALAPFGALAGLA